MQLLYKRLLPAHQAMTPELLHDTLLRMVAVLVVLLPLKVIEVAIEPDTAAQVSASVRHEDAAEQAARRAIVQQKWSSIAEVGHGVARRLDDAWFWVIAALTWACASIWTASTIGVRGRVQFFWTRSLGQLAPLMQWAQIIVIALYMVIAFLSKGTLFWWRGGLPELSWWRFSLITIVQVIEGLGHLFVITAIFDFIYLGSRAAQAVATSWEQLSGERVAFAIPANTTVAGVVPVKGRQTARRRKRRILSRRAASLIAACMRPFIAITIFLGVYELLVRDLEITDFGSGSLPAETFGLTAIASLPFLTLMAWSFRKWRASRVPFSLELLPRTFGMR